MIPTTLAQKRRATLTFVLLCVMAFIMYVDRTNLAVAAPTISKELGFSNTNLGMMFSAFAIAYSCFMIPGGWFSDRIGSRKAMLLYGIIWSVATIATGLVSGLVVLVIARFVVGIGEAPIYPTAARMIARAIPITQRGTAQGMMHASGRLANALAPLIVTFMIIQFSWRMTFVILGVVTLIYMFVMYFSLSESKKLVEATAAAPVAPVVAVPVNWPQMLRRVWPAAATCFCHGWVLWFFLNWIPSFFTQRYGMDLTHTAMFSTFVLLGGTVGTAVGGMLSDWRFKVTGNRLRSRRDLIIFGFLASIIGLIPLMFTHDLMICACGLSFSFFCSELADSPLWVIGTEVSHAHSATSSACTFTGMALAGAVSPVVIGWLLDITGNNWSVAFGASIAVVLMGPILAMFIKLDDEPAPEPVSSVHSSAPVTQG
ncbi:MFS transporter [Pseudomonas hormoni]|uniref:MFS transporter n=1 Tax=Pseudomonas hormoni TaxID=3093767 RepID=A0ABX8F401_9PSED|nr:MFS transporter [Pseudomonas hormoni]QVW25663.1 MFS transporter [Pseudomonas hormoni]